MAAGASTSAGASMAAVKRKRLFICCDGTWKDGINNRAPLTNVSRLARSLSHVSEDGCLQLVYYDSGIGNGTDISGQTIDGMTGRGISAKIRNAYSFISHNYQDGDQIILLGFSRGAFTAQCVASLIDQIGLLRKEDLQYLRPLFKLWKKQETKGWTGRTKINDDVSTTVKKLVAGSRFFWDVKIKACAVWDTVAALGLPTPKLSPRPFAFVGKTVPSSVEHAFQALALNETRHHFKPLVWTSAAKGCKKIKQCWFMGSHADVGGGNEDAGLAAVSLIWMASNLIDLGVSFVPEIFQDFTSTQYRELLQDVDKELGKLRSKLKFSSQASIEGNVNENGWYWFVAGLKFRGKYLKHYNQESSQLHQQRANDTQAEAGPSEKEPEARGKLPKEEPTNRTDDHEQRSSQLAEPFTMTIHFSVRLMMEAKRNSCDILKKWKTYKDSAGKIHWVYLTKKRTIQEDEGPRVAKPAFNGLFYEWYLLDHWFFAEQTAIQIADEERKESLLAFLYSELERVDGIPSKTRRLYNMLSEDEARKLNIQVLSD